jgi:hypothetical protein
MVRAKCGHLNRPEIVGAALGIAGIVFASLVPFSNIVTGPGTPLSGSQSLLGNFLFFLNNLNILQADKVFSLVDIALIYMSAFLLVLAGGLFGVYQPWGGALDIGGMLLATLGPFFVFPGYVFSAGDYGLGFYGLWIISVASFATWFWRRRMRQLAPKADMASPQVAAPQ